MEDELRVRHEKELNDLQEDDGASDVRYNPIHITQTRCEYQTH
jgi:hypothetical protein